MVLRPVLLRRLVAALTAVFLATAVPVLAGIEDHGNGTLHDAATGLTWVADPTFAIDSGWAGAAFLPRPEALAMVAAMNDGRLENFGRTDWRLPTPRELVGWLGFDPGTFAAASAVGADGAPRVLALPVAGAAFSPGIRNAVLVATNSLQIENSVVVSSGDVVVVDASPGPTLSATGAELEIGHKSRTGPGVTLKGDSVRIITKAVIEGDVVSNELDNRGTIEGTATSPLSLPVFSLLPLFETAETRPEATDAVVPTDGMATFAAGVYRDLTVGAGGTAILSGGAYSFASVSIGKNAELLFDGAASVRVAGRVYADKWSTIAPAEASGIDASQLIFYVGGIDGTDGLLGSLPRAFRIDHDAQLAANVYAPNGTVELDKGSRLTGAVIARDIRMDNGSAAALASFFVNEPPTADPKTVFTNGGGAITITLTGSDPEGDDLTFSILSGPSEGALGPVVEDPPPAPGDPPGCAPESCTTPPGAPRTSATVSYDPDTGDDLFDSFTYLVTDSNGNTGSALVTINPLPVDAPPPPPPTTVVALGVVDDTFEETAVTVTLRGNAPDGVGLTFALVGAGPTDGVLGPLEQGTGVPQRTATVLYTPNAGHLGLDSFDFEACGTIDGSTVCDSATATVETVVRPTEPRVLAEDIETTAFESSSVTVSLVGDSSDSAQSSALVVRPRAAVLERALVAGNVADADGDGLGDNANDLPGSAPIFMSAGVNQSGGPGSNGTVRIDIEFDVSGYGGVADELTNATVALSTHRGTIDSEPTTFFYGLAGNDGLLTPSDYERPVLDTGDIMLVPPGMAVGADGTFSLDVTDEVREVLSAGYSVLTIQGRVVEPFDQPGETLRGLEVRTTATGNLTAELEPTLSLTTSGPLPPPVTFTVTSLPASGSLFDAFGGAITAVPYTLPSKQVVYAPNAGFLGTDSFAYQGDDGVGTPGSATVRVTVLAFTCENTEAACDDGR